MILFRTFQCFGEGEFKKGSLFVFSIEDSGPELLSALLNHTITHRNLVEQVADKLSGREAAALIDRLVALIDMQELDVDRYRNILELLAVLVDGCAQRMLWDGKCHDAIRRAANCITEEVCIVCCSSSGYDLEVWLPLTRQRSSPGSKKRLTVL
uniref:Uncharacterized protein n=1 Tax=Parascaris equorum TaxID=6256 RepID=A0A914S5Q5_PAREQ